MTSWLVSPGAVSLVEPEPTPEPITCDVHTWIDANGDEHPLTLTNGLILGAPMGRFMPPVRRSDRRAATKSGSIRGRVDYAEREVAFPAAIAAADRETAVDAIRAWARRFNVLNGAGAIRATTPWGDERELICDYHDGLTINEADAGHGGHDTINADIHSVQRAVLVFRAVEPFWQDVEDSTAEYALEAGVATFFPIPNPTTGSFITLTGTTVLSTPTITNDGDLEAWPVFTITGPADGTIRIDNDTTGAFWSFERTLAAGDQVVIDTRPGYKTVTLDDGTNLFGSLAPTSELWPLTPGANQLTIQVTDVDENTLVEIAWRRRWLTV